MIMNENLIEHQKQLDKEIKETNREIRIMIKVCVYTSFFIILITTINVIMRGFTEGFT